MSTRRLPFKVVDGLALPADVRAALRPGELARDRDGELRRLPRYFYEVNAWKLALETKLAPHFALYELMVVDVNEAEILESFPRYIPCAVTLLAAQLELFRLEVGAPFFIAANGGYRSPSHKLATAASPHSWATAANIYKIGSDMLDNRETIERYAELARRVMPGIWTRPYGHAIGYADDHLHVDLGFVTVTPHGVAGEPEPVEPEPEAE